MNKRKNEALADINLYNFIRDNKKYKMKWVVKKTKTNVDLVWPVVALITDGRPAVTAKPARDTR